MTSYGYVDGTVSTYVPAFQAWLASLYAAGTPVTVYYQLATPTTATATGTVTNALYGSYTYISNSAGAKLLAGYDSANGSITAPTPDYSSPITSAGDTGGITVTAQGRNKFNLNLTPSVIPTGLTYSTSNNVLTVTNTTTDINGRAIQYDIDVNSLTPYYLNFNAAGSSTSNSGVRVDDVTNSTILKFVSTNGYSFTTASTTKKIRIFFYCTNSSANGGGISTFSNIQLEPGSAAHPYIPYFPPSSIVYATQLPGIPATYNADGSVATWAARDWIDADNGVYHRQRKRMILTGSEGAIYYAGYTNTALAVISPPLTTNKANVMCSNLPFIDGFDDKEHCVARVLGSTRQICLFLKWDTIGMQMTNTAAEKTAAINAWLSAKNASGNPVIVDYCLATEILEPLTPQTLATIPLHTDIYAGGCDITATAKIVDTTV